MVFIDGDKRTYVETYEMAMQQLNSGGFIVADNTLWDGHVVDHQYDNDHQTQGIERFNDHVAADPRVERVILPMRDGLTLIRKIPSAEKDTVCRMRCVLPDYFITTYISKQRKKTVVVCR